MKKIYTLLFPAVTILLFSIAAVALENDPGQFNVITSVPRDMTYQGILKDNAGNPLPDSMVTLVLRIYDDYTAGDLEWSDAIVAVTDDGGYFVATLAMVNLPFDEDYWLELEVEGEILMPRQKINMVGYSARSDTSDYAAVGGGWVDDGLNVRLESSYDKVGIGISSPSNKLHVVGSESVPILNVEQNGTFRATRFYSQNACALWVEHAGNHGLRVSNANGHGIYIQNAGSDGIRVDNAVGWAGYFSGKGYFADSVGIGTSSPAEKLEVDGSILVSEKATIGSGHTNSGLNAFVAGISNTATGNNSVISGGSSNTASESRSTVSGGGVNSATGWSSTVGGGSSCTASGSASVISGGYQNLASGNSSVVGGGSDNNASGFISTISGGSFNNAGGGIATVGGGSNNSASDIASTVCGGMSNSATEDYSIVGGGENNSSGGLHSGVFSGSSNTAGNTYIDTAAFVGGGRNNSAISMQATVSGGRNNTASGLNSAVSGGQYNTAGGEHAFVGGGENNVANGNHNVISGGSGNSTSGNYGIVSGGYNNSAVAGAVVGGGHNTASGYNSAILSGHGNLVAGSYSIALGGYDDTLTSTALYSMAFGHSVWIDSSYTIAFYNGYSSYSGKMGINRDDHHGGISYPLHIGTGTDNGNGAYLTEGGVWTNGSSRSFKENGQRLDGTDLLNKISNLNVESWNFIDSDERHIGPYAEEFVEAFDVGATREFDGRRENHYLAASDVAGVALAGVKELIQENKQLKDIIARLEKRISDLENK